MPKDAVLIDLVESIASVAVIITLYVPGVSGVPKISPLNISIPRPDGKSDSEYSIPFAAGEEIAVA